MSAASTVRTSTRPSAPVSPLPAGLRGTRATRALQALYAARPDEALSEPEVEAALAAAGVPVNRVTVYRLLDRFAAAGLLRRQVDAVRVTRYAWVATEARGAASAAPRFECDDCHRQFRLSQGSSKVQSALKQVLQALATAGHEGLAVDIAVRGRCAGCAAHPVRGAAA